MRQKRKKDKESRMDDSWLLPYADMLTLLLALFIVLFAMSEVDVQRYKELSQVFKREFSTGGKGVLDHSETPIDTLHQDEAPKEEETKDVDADEQEKETKESASEQSKYNLQSIEQEMEKYITENNLAEVLGTALTDEGLLITIRSDISFDSGSATVNEEGKEIAKELSHLIQTDPPHQMVISGHADDLPIHNADFQSNWELSVMRAVNFMGLLLENEALENDRFSAKGYGEHHPIAPNDTEKNRAKNRRVEILVLPDLEIKQENESN